MSIKLRRYYFVIVHDDRLIIVGNLHIPLTSVTDPASVIGISSAVVSLATIITKSIKSHSDLQSKCSIVDLKVDLLTGQLPTLKSALNHVATLAYGNSAVALHKELVGDLSVSLRCCVQLISILADRLSALQRNKSNGRTSSKSLPPLVG
ncbi:hypothetical protein F4778DRAFT_111322 [Xylariomycetidae sp. FL2044]|nr:hypothetical protein F4778DRAFT_111322 [Xylariomycetidae sp. FL2044]